MHKDKKSSVCLVGNSGEILGSGLGKKIDQCDQVIRFNDFLIDGFEDDCGSKTTIICLNFQPAAMLPNTKDHPDHSSRKLAENCEIWSARPTDVRLDGHAPYRRQRCIAWLGHDDIVYPSKEQWERSLENAYVGFWRQQPSTGLIAIEMVLDRFRDFDIFLCGFDFHPTDKDHYFDDIKEFDDPTEPHNGHGHNWPGEISYIKKLISGGRVHLLK